MITTEQLQAGIVLPLDKPRQWTSFQAVNKVKAVVRNTTGLKKFKIGHAGTLDPLATGLLLVCIGRATKGIPTLQDADKVYTGTMVLGATTPCYDLEQAIDRRFPYSHITPELIEAARRQFEGVVMQTPPMFSAVKVDGQRAYELARTGAEADVKAKAVNIYSFEITAFRDNSEFGIRNSKLSGKHDASANSEFRIPNSQLYKAPQGTVPPELPQLDFRITCGKGTYIRSLARDFGIALGSGAFLASLRRERIGQYSVADAVQIDQLEEYINTLTH